MSVAEITKQLEQLPWKERVKVTAFLEQFAENDEAAWLADAGRRIAKMKGGAAITRTELRRRLGVGK